MADYNLLSDAVAAPDVSQSHADSVLREVRADRQVLPGIEVLLERLKPPLGQLERVGTQQQPKRWLTGIDRLDDGSCWFPRRTEPVMRSSSSITRGWRRCLLAVRVADAN
jgi:hypothetical protein